MTDIPKTAQGPQSREEMSLTSLGQLEGAPMPTEPLAQAAVAGEAAEIPRAASP